MHGVVKKVAFERRLKMVGKRAREIGWWRKPRVRKILLSDVTLSEAGRKLGISTSQSKRLRDRAKQDLNQ
jgi:DNA-directed RNA polymerase specialized sigma subunit